MGWIIPAWLLIGFLAFMWLENRWGAPPNAALAITLCTLCGPITWIVAILVTFGVFGDE